MPQGADGQAIQIDRFFAGPGSRGDQWRSLVEIAEAGDRAKFDAALAPLAVTEAFHAYPGPQLLAALRDNKSDTRAIAALARRILRTLLTGAYRQNAGEWTEQEDESAVTADVLPPTLGRTEGHRPYFEVLIVTGVPATRWSALATEWRRLRRPPDQFVYEPVFVGSFEDAFCATVLNPNLAWAWLASALLNAFSGEPAIAIEHATLQLEPEAPSCDPCDVPAVDRSA